ncbi:hypothetical protein HanXRQr2_Chr08g0347441 [Helianthus annuus]|uniref:Uncharacterized protein n=1 Tax=Helianthus annuus TaxID=4232 RepID=A0A9K3IG49_HELAN|nr:hypothetical protein HanXRQr2_Chr08g0347441 [Helianthus annuus]KAJ0902325.1 hypothetical protein HanPSC8_Chr08g0335671 [Helianthus annuus]
MSWFSIYFVGEYSDESVVPDSYEGTAISASYDKLIPSNTREDEVVSGIRYRDNTVQLDLNIPVEDSYAQHGYSDYRYGGEPYPQAEYPYGSQTIPTKVTMVIKAMYNKTIPTTVTVVSRAMYN